MVVVTASYNRENLEKAGIGKAKIVYVNPHIKLTLLEKIISFLRAGGTKGWTLQMLLNYPNIIKFERGAWRLLAEEIKAGKFDLVHRVSPMSPTLPSYLARVCPIPTVVGPLNGGLKWPNGFLGKMFQEREWLHLLRSAYRFLPFNSSTYKKATCVLPSFQHTIDDLPKGIDGKSINFPEVGINPEMFSYKERPEQDKVTIVTIGRLVPYKQPDVLVEAIARSPLLQQQKTMVVGEGPEAGKLKDLIRTHNLEGCVELTGQISHKEVSQLMNTADIFAFPSIRELGAGAVIEAMASGMACVVPDYGAPGTLIGEGRGLSLPFKDRESLIEEYVGALERLVKNPEERRSFGAAAHEHAKAYYSWENKAKKTREIYDWILGGMTGVKPDFWQGSEKSEN